MGAARGSTSSRLAGLVREHGVIELEDLPAVGLAYLLATEPLETPILVVTATDERAEELVSALETLRAPDVALFPGEPHTPIEEVSPDPASVVLRQHLRARLALGETPRVVVAPVSALLPRWMPASVFAAHVRLLRVGERVDRDTLLAELVRCGFQRVSLVEDEGTFAVRGGIVDVFSPGEPHAIRLDLFGDELAGLERFDVSTQRVVERVDVAAYWPIREVVYDDEALARADAALRELGEQRDIPTRRLRALRDDLAARTYFFGIESLWPFFYEQAPARLDTLLGDGRRVVWDDVAAIHSEAQRFVERARLEHERALAKHRPVPEVAMHLLDHEEALRQLEAASSVRHQRVVVEAFGQRRELGYRPWDELARELRARREDLTRGEVLDPLVEELRRQLAQEREVWFVCPTRGHAERLRELLRGRRLDLPVRERLPEPELLGARRTDRAAIAIGALTTGLCDPERGVALFAEVELLGADPKRRRKRRTTAPREGGPTLAELTPGDLVIHIDHGIGRYVGLRRLVLAGVDGDYLQLEYADQDKLYVPVVRLSVLQRYRGGDAKARLDKLGGSRWAKAKQRVKDEVLALAHELLAVQARRNTIPGFALPPPDDAYQAFEATFPYEETPDQQRAIDEVLADLQRDSPMDRLVCGDVGFGKTEVAIRAAFLAVQAGKQVAVLVPTTVLAEQHGQRFAERFHGQPINVEVLSRFRSAREVQDILQRSHEGRVDVLIGTHRLLSGDVRFRDLGLLVIDEEQRFGVKHKERIKQWKSEVHVLTLSATPIPRTLHMASVGLRDLSLIATPPAERTSIRTEVSRFDEAVIQEALLRELHRGGQVFVVHNRVQSIGAMAALVRRLVPEARVAVAHGQMSGEELERIMSDFVRRETNVLVSTAIIESGIDIPSANTMIVNRADQFGLAQLYQLRGRIGRSRERAYAYLLLPHGDHLGREALERVALLKRFSDLGSGFQIASHDLDLRGAGDLLGHAQSGNIAAVGFELYTELLAEAVERARGQVHRVEVEPELKLPVTAVLPESYLPDPMLRLDFYQRMATARSDEAVFDVFTELGERFGEPPDEVQYLAEVMVIRRRLRALGCTQLSVTFHEGKLSTTLAFIAQPYVDAEKLAGRLQREPQRYRLLPSGKLAISVPFAVEPAPLELLRTVRTEVGQLEVAKA